MYLYTAFELNFYSELFLPELLPGTETKPDVVVRFGPVAAPVGDDEGSIECFRADVHEVVLTWAKVGALLVRDGKEMILDPILGVNEAALRLMLLGSGLALILHQRGLTVLHASAVAIAGRAVAFLADKGWGKSSTAAALCQRGHVLVTDDLLAIHSSAQGRPLALFGYPQIKLWPDTLSALGYQPEALSCIRPDVDKRAYPVVMPLDGGLPLERIYFLGNGSSLAMTSMPTQTVFSEIMRNLYVPAFGPVIFEILDPVAILEQCARLTHNVATRLIHRTADLSSLPDIARLIEYDLAQNCPGNLVEPLTLADCH